MPDECKAITRLGFEIGTLVASLFDELLPGSSDEEARSVAQKIYELKLEIDELLMKRPQVWAIRVISPSNPEAWPIRLLSFKNATGYIAFQSLEIAAAYIAKCPTHPNCTLKPVRIA